MTAAIILLVWIVSGVITVGALLADTQAHCPTIADEWYRRDLAMACFFGLFGPVGLFITIFDTGFFEHGLQFRRKK